MKEFIMTNPGWTFLIILVICVTLENVVRFIFRKKG